MGVRGMMGRDSTACMLHKGRSKPGSRLKMSDCFSVMWATPLKWMSCRLEILGLRLEHKESKRHFGFSKFWATVTSAEMWIQVSSQTELSYFEGFSGRGKIKQMQMIHFLYDINSKGGWIPLPISQRDAWVTLLPLWSSYFHVTAGNEEPQRKGRKFKASSTGWLPPSPPQYYTAR